MIRAPFLRWTLHSNLYSIPQDYLKLCSASLLVVLASCPLQVKNSAHVLREKQKSVVFFTIFPLQDLYLLSLIYVTSVPQNCQKLISLPLLLDSYTGNLASCVQTWQISWEKVTKECWHTPSHSSPGLQHFVPLISDHLSSSVSQPRKNIKNRYAESLDRCQFRLEQGKWEHQERVFQKKGGRFP